MNKDKLQLGNKITKRFDGGQFEETGIQRRAINLILSILNCDVLTEEEKLVYDEFKKYNNKIEEMLK